MQAKEARGSLRWQMCPVSGLQFRSSLNLSSVSLSCKVGTNTIVFLPGM